MNREVTPDDLPVMFSARTWNSLQESWEDYLHAVERAYAQYVDCARRTSMGDQTRLAPDSDEQEL